tara:strand:- start:186 stop:1703 length:1518 start_codon:yes stop_codon:yes gene_type:complete
MVNTDIFLGSGASLTLVPELDFYIEPDASPANGHTAVTLDSSNQSEMQLVADLYVGCTLDFYAASALQSSHIITGNTATVITFTPAIGSVVSSGYYILKSYGAPCPAPQIGSNPTLNSDNWLGLVETAAFPSIEVEPKLLNTSLGGSRNWTHQYKGIETASGGTVSVMANHFAWMYYVLGNCATLTPDAESNPTNPSNYHTALGENEVYFNTSAHLAQGPVFYRSLTSSRLFTPPLLPVDFTGVANIRVLTLPTTTSTLITYGFTEANGEDLPSFALEQTLTKNPLELTSDGTNDNTFVRIARGNRVNDISLTANENEEVKVAMNLNTRAVHTVKEAYEARRGITDNTALFNYNTALDAFSDPFFYSGGTLSAFGQTFLKITNMTLTINNNLQDKRFLGSGSKSIKDAIPAQRDYEVQFTGMITDDSLYTALTTDSEYATNGSSNLLTLTFTKGSESMTLNLQDYLLNAATITIPEDKGPITLEGTIKPRSLTSCSVETHWILQG